MVEGAEFEKLDEIDDLYVDALPLFSNAFERTATLGRDTLDLLPTDWGLDKALRVELSDFEFRYHGLRFDEDIIGNNSDNQLWGGGGSDFFKSLTQKFS